MASLLDLSTHSLLAEKATFRCGDPRSSRRPCLSVNRVECTPHPSHPRQVAACTQPLREMENAKSKKQIEANKRTENEPFSSPKTRLPAPSSSDPRLYPLVDTTDRWTPHGSARKLSTSYSIRRRSTRSRHAPKRQFDAHSAPSRIGKSDAERRAAQSRAERGRIQVYVRKRTNGGPLVSRKNRTGPTREETRTKTKGKGMRSSLDLLSTPGGCRTPPLTSSLASRRMLGGFGRHHNPRIFSSTRPARGHHLAGDKPG